jgi:hypothetical protein
MPKSLSVIRAAFVTRTAGTLGLVCLVASLGAPAFAAVSGSADPAGLKRNTAARNPTIPIDGGAAEQRATTRAVLRAMGEPRAVRHVHFTGAGVRVELKSGVAANPARNRESFIAQVIAGELLRRLEDSDHPIQRAVVVGAVRVLPFAPSATRPRLAPAQLRARVRARAPRVANVRLRSVKAFPVSIGAVEIVAEPSVRQILEGREAGVLERLLPRGSAKAARLTLVTSDGAVLSSRGFIGNLIFGTDRSSPQIASPDLPAGPTKLVATFTTRGFSGPEVTATVNLDCDIGTGIPEASRVCDELRADWLHFLPSPPVACFQPGKFFSVRIQGTFAGVAIDRESERCTGIDPAEWATLLSIPVPIFTPPARR